MINSDRSFEYDNISFRPARQVFCRDTSIQSTYSDILHDIYDTAFPRRLESDYQLHDLQKLGLKLTLPPVVQHQASLPSLCSSLSTHAKLYG